VTRAVRISLDLATSAKRARLSAFLREYRTAANFYARSLWTDKGGFNGETLRRYTGGSLGYSQRNSALKSAVETISSARATEKATGRRPRCPVFRRASCLTHHVCRIEVGRGAFDFVMKIMSMTPREPIVIPFKSHARLNYWLSKPGAKLLDGAIVTDKCAWVYVRVPNEPLKIEGATIGLDIGFNKLIADSDGNFHGQQIKTICANIRRKKPGSLAKKRARKQRRDYVNFVCRRLPWQTTKTFVLEDLIGMKVGKGSRGKRNRKFLAPWSYRQVRTRLTQLAEENRVGLQFVNPHGTSRTCPSCGLEKKENREKEQFRCVACNYTGDSDHIAARNILNQTLGNCPEITIPVGTC